MKKTAKTISILMAAGFMVSLGGLAHAGLFDVDFGSDNDGLGGFSTVGNRNGNWRTQTNSINFTQSGSGRSFREAQLWTELSGTDALDTSAGSSYTFTGVIDLGAYSGLQSASNFGIQLFSTSGNVSNTGITLFMYPTRPTMAIYPSGSGSWESGHSTNARWNGERLGRFTFKGKISFTDTHADVSFALTDSGGHSQTISTSIPLTSINLGERFRIGARIRDNNHSFIMDVESFTAHP